MKHFFFKLIILLFLEFIKLNPYIYCLLGLGKHLFLEKAKN